jgi:hypothetical protein
MNSLYQSVWTYASTSWYHIWKPVKKHIRDSTHKHKCTRALTKEEESFTCLIRIKVTCMPKKAKFVYSYKKSNKVFHQMLWKEPNDHKHGWSWRYWPPAHITWLASHAHGVLQTSLKGKETIDKCYPTRNCTWWAEFTNCFCNWVPVGTLHLSL